MLEFRGQSLQDGDDPLDPFCKYWFDLIEGIPLHESPSARGKDVIIPGRAGRQPGNRDKDVLNILIEGFIRGVGDDRMSRAIDWHTNTALILGQLELDDPIGDLMVGPGMATIPYLGLTADYTIRARPVDQMPGTIHYRTSYQQWSFKFEAIREDETYWSEVESS